MTANMEAIFEEYPIGTVVRYLGGDPSDGYDVLTAGQAYTITEHDDLGLQCVAGFSVNDGFYAVCDAGIMFPDNRQYFEKVGGTA